ncbi:MAG: hypothetical protein ACR2O0_10680 [Rhizobiaceae bacterium]
MIFNVEDRVADAGLPSQAGAGNSAIKTAIVFAAIGMGLAVLVAPTLHNTVSNYAAYNAGGIDRIQTGSVHRGDRYTIRKSVLSAKTQKICESRFASACLEKK